MKTERLPFWEIGAVAMPLGLVGLASLWIHQTASVSHHAVGCWDRGFLWVVGIAAAMIGVAAWRNAIGPRLMVAVGLLAIAGGFLGARFFGVWPFSFDLLSDPRHIGFLALISTLAAGGLAFRTIWGRWLALGLGAAGLLSGALNTLAVWSFHSGSCLDGRLAAARAWPYVLFAAWSAALLAALVGPAVRDSLLARSKSGAIWGSSHRLVRIVRWTLFANLVAIPMLLVYGWVQPVVPTTISSAFVLAGLLGLGTVLTMGRKVVGALLLSIGGVGLFAHTLATMSLAQHSFDFSITVYYGFFWLPAALLSVACGVVIARPVWRLLRR